MSLIYNALKEQDHPTADETDLIREERDVISPPAPRQRKSLSHFRTLMIIGGLLLIGSYLWHAKGPNNFPAVGRSSTEQSAAGGSTKNDVVPVSETKTAVVPIKNSLNPGKSLPRQTSSRTSSVADISTLETANPARLSPPMLPKKVIDASVQTSAVASTQREVKPTAAAEKITVLSTAVKKILPPVKSEPAGIASPNTELSVSSTRLQSPQNFLRETGELVTQVKVSMRNRDTARTESLLQDLEQKAGSGSIIVLQMRAYWLLQQQKNDMAQKAYRQLLAEQPDDMAANLNMAVLELRVGNHRQAKERLTRMALLYPDSEQVLGFLHKVRAASGR